MRPVRLIAPCAALGALALAPAAEGATSLTVRGAGWGHGVGMSQYGAYGMARAGKSYDAILRHYYSGTALAELDSEPTVRVLLASGASAYGFAGAGRLGGKLLDPARTYTAALRRGRIVVSDGRRRLFRVSGTLRVTPPTAGTLRFAGGRYRGALQISPSGGGLIAVNALGLESYVRGVVARESPAGWPAEALKAQAVAARTYAVTTAKTGGAFDQYADTRSQVYGGANAETTTTNAAIAATRGEVVTYGGEPAVTFFFSTSGGRTENVENSFLGSSPKPWLRSVRDPYDRVSPKHRWGPIRLTAAQAQARLGGYVRGRLVRIRVTRRGVSPRIVSARVVGTRGSAAISGPQLRSAFGLNDTWIYFTTVRTSVRKPRKPAKRPAAPVAPVEPSTPSNGGAGVDGAYAAAVRAASRPVLAGEVHPARRGAWLRVQRREGARWRTATHLRLGAGGRYAVTALQPGVYRVAYGRTVVGAAVRVP
jgi:stage II sporulation protein D